MRVFDSRKALAFGVLLLASTLAVMAVTPKGTAAVKDIAIAAGTDSLEATITTTAPARFTYFELTGPRRLVVDFHDLQNGVGFREKQVSAAGVQRVRTGLFQSSSRNVARIVFDLTADAHYQVVDDKSAAVRVLFGQKRDSVPEDGPLHTLPAAKTNPVLAAEVKIPANLMVAPVMVPSMLSISPRVNLQSLTLSPREIAAMPPAPGLMLASAAPAGIAGLAQISVVPPIVPGSTLTANPQSQAYTGDILTFDVRDLELKDFFRAISEISGLNIVMDPNVSGTLPMLRLTDVPWDQALDVVLKQNQLGGQLQGNVLRIATNSTLQAEETARKAQADAREALSELVTHTYILNYTKADAVAGTLTQSQTVSKRGQISHDVRKNALIVTDIPSQFARVDQMVKFLDTPAQQVEIEARLLSANKSFSKDLGSQIGLLIGNKNILSGASGAVSPLTRAGGAALPLATNFPAAASSGLGLLLQPGSDVLLDGILTAAESHGQAKLLSAPRITTQNNMAAQVSQGTQIPVQTSVNNTVTTSFINFALNLTVTPQITEAGTILLTVLVENSVPDFARTVNGIPSVATQKTTTQVLIPDGGTAVIGGIYVDTDSLNVHQVPGLGSLPVIGHIFKETATIKSTSELIFFVTPKIKSLDQIIATVPDIRDSLQK